MLEEFENLSEEEKEVLFNAPVYVSVLMAGADDKIDKKEKNLAISLAKMKTYRARKILVPYYNILHKDFEDRMNQMIADLPSSASERNPIIESQLERLNSILPKLEFKFSSQFYESLRDFAKQVAEASGGIFGYLSVNVDESKYIELKMIKRPEN